MKIINLTTCLAILIANFFTGCHKDPAVEEADPVANFTFDKDTFIAGETVHCKNTSTNAYGYKWTAPDGSISTAQNLDYYLDSATLSATQLFKLEVTSKSGNKTDTVSKSTVPKELILPGDFFAVGNAVYKPVTKSSGNNQIYWGVSASEASDDLCYNGLIVLFYGNSSPMIGSYSCQPSHPTAAGQVYIQIGAPTGIECPSPAWYISTSGQLDVSYTNNGKLHIVFNSVPATGGVLISGDITAH